MAQTSLTLCLSTVIIKYNDVRIQWCQDTMMEGYNDTEENTTLGRYTDRKIQRWEEGGVEGSSTFEYAQLST